MYYDNFDTSFGMAPGFDSIGSEFGTPMFNGTGCFPAPSFDIGYNGGFTPSFDGGFGMGMPITCGYTPAPLGCNPVSMDFSGNVCIDGIPITTNTPPAWMTARAFQAEMHLNQLEAQLNDPNFWMNFIPQSAFNMPMFPTIDTTNIDWNAVPVGGEVIPNPLDAGFPMALDQMDGMPMGDTGMANFSMPQADEAMNSPLVCKGEEVLPCGLTQSAYDSILASCQKNLADCERQLADVDPYHSAQRAMIQNNIDRINRNIRDLDKPLGKI